MLTFFTAAMALAGVCRAQEVCRPPADGDWPAWLDAQEGMGGHTLACHVGVAENGLIHRIAYSDAAAVGCRLPEESDRASAWSDKGALIGALKQISPKQWRQVANGGVIEGVSDYPVGLVVKAGQARDKRMRCLNSGYTCQGATRYVLVFRQPAGGPCHLLTAYPK